MALELGPVIGKIGGGGVEEIPFTVSGSGGSAQTPAVFPIGTVDAGNGALIVMTGTVTEATSGSSGRPLVTIGDTTHTDPHEVMTALGSYIGGIHTGTVDIAMLSQSLFGTSSIVGTVYVAQL